MKIVSDDDLRAIDSRYKVKERFFESLTAFGYYATEVSSREEVLLIVHRYLHDPHGTFANRFAARQKKIAEASDIFNPSIYSIATNGLAYIVLPKIEGRLLLSFKGLGSGAEPLFCKIVAAIKELHSADIALGDLSDRSFILDSNDNLHFLGSFGYVVEKTPEATDELAQYTSPEQFSSDRFDIRSDIFSIGALGYRLFTGHFIRDAGGENLLNPARNAPAPSSFDSKISIWTDAVIGACLSGERQNRYSSAVELTAAIIEGIETGLAPGGANPWLSRTVTQQAIEDSSSATKSNISEGSSSIAKFLPIVTAVIFAVIALFFIIKPAKESTEIVIEKNELVATLIELAPAELKEEIALLENNQLTAAAIIEILTKVSASDNPVAIMLLHSAIRGEIGENLPEKGEIRTFAIKKYIEKLSSQGLSRTAGIWGNWFSAVLNNPETFSRMGLFESSVQAVDIDRDPKSRRAALQKIFEQEPELAILLATSFILDHQKNDAEEFKPMVRIFLQSRNIPNAHGRKFEELMLAYQKTVSAFPADAGSLVKELTNNELSWVLQATLAQKGKLAFEILDEVVKRDIVPPYQKVFLEPLVSTGRNTLPEHIVNSLMSAALGDISVNTLQNLSTWGGKSFERVFLSFAAIAPERETSLRSIEILDQRVVSAEPAKTLLSWFRKQPGASKADISKAIGILSLIDIATEEDVSYAFNTILSNSGGRELFHSAMSSDNERLQREVVDRVGPIVQFDEVIPLLRHKDAVIRIAAIRLLKENNNITVLNELVRSYEEETDPNVRAVYEAENWVIQQRKQ